MPTLPPGCTLVRTRPGNVHLLIPLFLECVGRHVSHDYLVKKYSSPWGNPDLFYGFMILDPKGKAIAHHCAIPMQFSFPEGTFRGAHSCDSLTSAPYRGQGLFAHMGTALDAILKADGFDFIYGFSNENSLPAATKKLGWQRINSLNGYKIKVRTLPLEKIFRRLRFPYRLYLSLVGLAFRRHRFTQPIPNSCLGPDSAGLVRDEAYYRYHSFSFNRRIRLGQVSLWFNLYGCLGIGEMEKAPETEILSALRTLKRKCFWLGINEIVFQTSPGTYHDALFQRNFPSFPSWTTLGNNFSHKVDLSTIRLSFGDLDSF